MLFFVKKKKKFKFHTVLHLILKGLIDREEGNNIEALRYLQKALELNSKNIETYKEIGKTL